MTDPRYRDVAEWLLAQIAADEEVARACVGPEWETGLPATIHPNPEIYRTVIRQVGHVCGSIIAADATHIARWDPAHVLAECASKRAVVDDFTDAQSRVDGGDSDYRPRRNVLRSVLIFLAQPYRDRAGYRTEWDVE